jgi:predicted transcriptional regulator
MGTFRSVAYKGVSINGKLLTDMSKRNLMRACATLIKMNKKLQEDLAEAGRIIMEEESGTQKDTRVG